MDNITHVIAGIVAAEAIVQIRARRGGKGADARFSRAAWLVSAIGHNLPDADAVYTGITGGALGYLLHHRGHTHTLALAPLLALLAYVVGSALARLRATGNDRLWLAAIALQAPIGHLALDYGNDYGVHPFWPLSNRWIYGDTIFIVEPLFWACATPMILLATRSRLAKVVWGLVLASGLVLTWTVDMVPRGSALATTIVAAVAIGVSARAAPARRVAFALAASLFVVALFAAGSAKVSASARATLALAEPGWETIDLARAPLPATPLCWSVVVVQRSRDGERFALRRGVASAWPGLVTALDCSRGRAGPAAATAPLTNGKLHEPALVVHGQLDVPIAELASLASRCDVAAYLRWARAPFVAPDGEGLVVGDLRYDQSAGIDFAEMRLPARVVTCPANVPPWTPPREDVIAH